MNKRQINGKRRDHAVAFTHVVKQLVELLRPLSPEDRDTVMARLQEQYAAKDGEPRS